MWAESNIANQFYELTSTNNRAVTLVIKSTTPKFDISVKKSLEIHHLWISCTKSYH